VDTVTLQPNARLLALDDADGIEGSELVERDAERVFAVVEHFKDGGAMYASDGSGMGSRAQGAPSAGEDVIDELDLPEAFDLSRALHGGINLSGQ